MSRNRLKRIVDAVKWLVDEAMRGSWEDEMDDRLYVVECSAKSHDRLINKSEAEMASRYKELDARITSVHDIAARNFNDLVKTNNANANRITILYSRLDAHDDRLTKLEGA